MSKTGAPRKYSLARYSVEANREPFPLEGVGEDGRTVLLRQPTTKEMRQLATMDFEDMIRLLAPSEDDAQAIIDGFEDLPANAANDFARDFREHCGLGG